MNKIIRKEETMLTWECDECGQYFKALYEEQMFQYIRVHMLKHKVLVSDNKLLSLLKIDNTKHK